MRWRPSYPRQYRVAVTRALSHEEAERVMGTGLSCRGIHLPKDPSPRTLSGVAARFWDSAYRSALSYYGEADAEGADATAKKTAWKTLRSFFVKRGRQWVLRPSLPVPGTGPVSFIGNPGDLDQLGVCLEYTFVDGNAVLQIRRFPDDDPPYLYWSHQFKTCYVFPGAERGECMPPDLKSIGAKIFKIWTQRNPECVRMVDVPEVDVRLDGFFDTVVYRSDKWHDPNPDDRMIGSQEYIHQVGDGVGTWQAAGQVPPAMAFGGGCMELHGRGLIH